MFKPVEILTPYTTKFLVDKTPIGGINKLAVRRDASSGKIYIDVVRVVTDSYVDLTERSYNVFIGSNKIGFAFSKVTAESSEMIIDATGSEPLKEELRLNAESVTFVPDVEEFERLEDEELQTLFQLLKDAKMPPKKAKKRRKPAKSKPIRKKSV